MGTARLTGSSPYCSRWSVARIVISRDRSSPIARMPSPSTAAIWWPASFSSLMCSAHSCNIAWILSTLPVPAYAHASSTRRANRFVGSCSSVASTSAVASAASCRPRNTRPSASARNRAPGVARSSAELTISRSTMVSAASPLLVPTYRRPRERAAEQATWNLLSGSDTMGASSSITSSRSVPAYASPSPTHAASCTSALSAAVPSAGST
mmetsp:Transcript_29698/g.97122  ORF Transcript_29698/g.97122 Transcript_29698/m.97122 type:complete len:210 (+) Transcript_29698:755-1384(+)